MRCSQACSRALRCSLVTADTCSKATLQARHVRSQRSPGLSQCHALKRPSSLISRQFTSASTLRFEHQDDTIYALSTAPGRAAIAIVRISGPAALQIYNSLCPNRPPPKPRTATLRQLHHPTLPSTVLDNGALILYFPGPATVTGEDVLELHIHGGNAIVRGVLEAIPKCAPTTTTTPSPPSALKIRAAEPGEFTKRAFYNTRIDLPSVESLGETLAAETEQQRRLALSGSASALTSRYESWRSMLLDARGELEALIDFSEDQHFDESPAQLMGGTSQLVVQLRAQIRGHVANASRGELLRSGISVALLGAPNAGKSSLLNRVVGREAAIVSAEEGTTRDIVDVSVDLGGWLVRLGDMAGVRAGLASPGTTSGAVADLVGRSEAEVGAIEREGIRRARERALQSDLVIVLVSVQPTIDGSVELSLNSELLSAVAECREAGKQMLFALNKIDLLHTQTAAHKVSLSRLLGHLIERFPETDPNEVFCLSCREADVGAPVDDDAGGLQNFLTGLTRKFSDMTRAAVGGAKGMTPAEAQSYWNASLSVTHRQQEYLKECLVHLEDFLELSAPEVLLFEQAIKSKPAPSNESSRLGDSRSGFFDTTDTSPPTTQQYHIDNHEDLVGEIEVDTTKSNGDIPTIPYSWATQPPNADMEDIDIVTAAEHLRAAADCLAKLTGRGDGVTSGADVEDVLGVVFEK